MNQLPPSGDITKIPELVAESLIVEPEEVFPGFRWRDGEQPAELGLNEHGFFEDSNGSWYLTRVSKYSESLDDARPVDLYNSPKHQYRISVLGPGLYCANHLPALNISHIGKGKNEVKNLYVLRIDPGEDILDAPSSLRRRELGGVMSKLLLRFMYTTPGAVPPTRGMYEYLYRGKNIVVLKPSLVQKRSSKSLELPDQKVKPRWAIITDPSKAEVVGQKLAA